MYRVLIILAFSNFVQAHQWCNNQPNGCHRHHHDYGRHHDRHNERFFQRLADDLIEVDNKAKTFCAQNQETTFREVYEQDVYKYIIGLPNYNESNIEVKIKYRVLYIKAEKDGSKYANVKILTDLLNTTAAKWCYGNEELKVAVPYKIAVTDEVPSRNCGDEINRNILDVPKYEYDPNEEPEIDVRFSNQAETQNITENIV